MAKVLTMADTKREQRRAYWSLVCRASCSISVMAFPTIFSVVLSLTSYNGGKLFAAPSRWSA